MRGGFARITVKRTTNGFAPTAVKRTKNGGDFAPIAVIVISCQRCVEMYES